MIQLAVECLKFGELGVRSAPSGAFEVIRFGDEGGATAVARIEVDRCGHPALKITRLDPEPRSLNPWAMATVEKAVLESWRDEQPTDCRLTAAHKEAAVELVLSGHCGYRLFWWRAEIAIAGGAIAVRGPFLANDPGS